MGEDYGYLGINDGKLRHCLMVAKLMYEISLDDGKTEDFAREMFTLGYLHDIGYEFSLNTKEHPKVGGELLKFQGYKYYKEIIFHGSIDCPYSSYALDLLNKVDLMVDSHGQNIGATERIKDIRVRYGENSKEYKNACILAKRLKLI